MSRQIIERHVCELSYVYWIDVDEDFRFFILRDFRLPPGYNLDKIDIWTEIPYDYPESPPGVGDSHVYVPASLKYRGRKPNDFHPEVGPEGWAWWCYERIYWDSCKDDLIGFFEIVRAHMTEPD